MLVTVLAAVALVMALVFHDYSGHAPSRMGDGVSISGQRVAVSAAKPVTLTVEPDHPRSEFALGMIGLSIEAKELDTPDLSADHRSLVRLLKRLGPGVLRIAGGSVDYSWWTGNDEPPPAWATSVVSESDLVTLNRLLVVTGWRVILGVNFGHFDAARAAGEARAAERIFGAKLVGIEIGNEPDAYGKPGIGLRPSSYSVGTYLDEVGVYKAAIGSAAPKVKLYGPDLWSQAWLPAISASSAMPFAALTQHYYPTSYSVAKGSCKATPVPTPSELLSTQVREDENKTLRALAEAGELAHTKTLLSETNATGSCDTNGGPATSPVFASALWSLDWALRAASAGVSGINFHGYIGYCGPSAMAPICAGSYLAESQGQVSARPEYYGMMAARQLEGGRFVSTRLSQPARLPDITTWATVGRGGTVRMAIDDLATEGAPQPLSIAVAGYRASFEVLRGPSVEATSGITLGRAEVTGSGEWRPRPTRWTRSKAFLRVVVRPSSAIIVTLRPT